MQNKPRFNQIFKNVAKSPMKSTQQTVDMDELVENSAAKRKDRLSSPSAIKPSFQKCQSPRARASGVIKKLDYEDSPIRNVGLKRKSEQALKTEKKVKRSAWVEFYDPEEDKIKMFRCFNDSAACNKEICKGLAQNECDDDCATTLEIKEASKQYLVSSLIEAILNFDNKRKTI